MTKHSQIPLVDELPAMLIERRMSVAALARAIGVSQPHLSRVLRRADYRTPSAELAAKVARQLGLPDDYWPEYRAAKVIERIRSDPAYRDRLYASLPRPGN